MCFPHEGVNLPNIRCEFRKMFYRCFHRQSRIGELFFGSKIIIQGVFYAVEIGVDNRLAVQYPSLLGNVVFSYLSGVVEYALEQSAVNGDPLSRRKLKRLFAQKLSDPCGNDVGFLCSIFDFRAGSSLFVIAVNTLLRFIDSDFTLDMFLCGIQQIIRGFQSVNRL